MDHYLNLQDSKRKELNVPSFRTEHENGMERQRCLIH